MSDPTIQTDSEDWGIDDSPAVPEDTATGTASEENPKPKRSRRPAGRRSTRRSGSFTPAQARKAVEVARRLFDASDDEFDVAVTLAGISGDRDDLAVAILTGKAASSDALTDLREIDDAEELEAAVVAGIMGRPRMTAVWELLKASGVDVPAEAPEADTKLALRLAAAVRGLSDQERAVLSSATDLLSAS